MNAMDELETRLNALIKERNDLKEEVARLKHSHREEVDCYRSELQNLIAELDKFSDLESAKFSRRFRARFLGLTKV